MENDENFWVIPNFKPQFYKLSQLFINTIEENKDIFSKDNVVELGAGGGSFSYVISKYPKKLYPVDISEDAIEALKTNLEGIKNIEILKVDPDKLPFDNKSIDTIFTANSFHYLPEGYEKEISRVIKEGGHYVDIDFKKENTDFGPPYSVRLSEEQAINRLKKEVFQLVNKIDLDSHYMLIFIKK